LNPLQEKHGKSQKEQKMPSHEDGLFNLTQSYAHKKAAEILQPLGKLYV